MSKATQLLRRFKELNEDEIYEMANLRKNTTGAVCVIWVTQKTSSAHSESPYIKVQNNHNDKVIGDPSGRDPNWASMTISSNPTVVINQLDKDIEDSARAFVIKNQQLLLDLYNGKIMFFSDFLMQVQKI